MTAEASTLKRVRKTVGETGEFNLIDRIRKILPVSRDKDLIVDIGDDTAVVRLDGKRALLLTCDIQVEGRHFLFDRTTPYRVGRRSMAVNLSDIASMGGKPTYALVSLGLPAELPVETFDRLFEGMRDEMLAHGAYVIGGNLARTREELVVDVTLLGEVELSRVLTRGGARPGDRIFVTGTLGASGAGMEALKLYGKKVPGKYRELADRHVLPVPRVEMGRRISRSGVASAMIDLSDGVAGGDPGKPPAAAEAYRGDRGSVRKVDPRSRPAQRGGLRAALHRPPRRVGEEDPGPSREDGGPGDGDRKDRGTEERVPPGGFARRENRPEARRLGPFPERLRNAREETRR
jgi:thiamine monophosphate kinase